MFLPGFKKLISATQRIPYLLFILKKKLLKSNFYLHEKFLNILFINETKEKYLPQLRNIVIDKSTWINGYWQSPLYFQHHKAILQKCLIKGRQTTMSQASSRTCPARSEEATSLATRWVL